MSKQTLFNIIVICIASAALLINVVTFNRVETLETDVKNLYQSNASVYGEQFENINILKAHINRLNKMNGFELITVASDSSK